MTNFIMLKVSCDRSNGDCTLGFKRPKIKFCQEGILKFL